MITLASACLLIAGLGDIPSFAKELPEIRSGEPAFRFNGKDLDGFFPYTRGNGRTDPNGVFTVADGMIRISGQDFGAITTDREFSDYHLVVEWKWGEKTCPPREKATRDSGILLHAIGEDGVASGAWMESVECQLIEGGSGDIILVGGKGKPSLTVETRTEGGQLYWEKGGKSVTNNSGRFNWWGRDPKWKDVLGYRGPNDVEKPVGEWNTMEVVADGDNLTYILNGVVVNAGTKSSLKSGRIQVQSEGAELFVRKFEVRPLKP